jgi:hypothetical protein
MKILFHKATRPRREVGHGSSRESCRLESTGQGWARPSLAIGRPTVVAFDLDIGSTNAVFIRGNGAGLRWDKGEPLARVGPRTWVWSAGRSQDRVEFQLLLNDEIWARGETQILEPGSIIEVTPDFEWPEIPKISPIHIGHDP